ncbi:MAG: hypothetical protein UU73_C0003G0139 [Candidatus Daviesbacteria bacterium GW2011_GWA1_41_61]|uniref:Nucleotidyl transferase AbiEii/AbiGii toxin family protein n=1 Tax=Candidatus Daviesbacteria bacterium GW2011_GWA2_40_9 TaxID=1618424 RepID=A0A0G0U252_9BACT|nr:MAG: hypothetical protein UU26_C0003G0087 [Candidatus Daviesbacteria bacterium GW2011_GWC1_40_9]KKR83164.1 MAG: hypothetical protein UU29_C0007G0034 [Candidatus Daviesbacteria bacterium GW2011_GWA2_40_9]KKR93511.1 MAG: hypothetical protein UU44_C0002G0172 [Candidatus Daviesbacteria bacterium GW2011_GWB1_41_15]KKS14940.1 MAG: hypothetical protein UU73_C0003G0139 [Candidatus Daviesbacteria bacterium GW2011_GWA1_41_61]
MNKNTLKLHLDILDNKRRELLQTLLPLTKGFVLSGGTALALQLVHRKSFDFDFFSTSQIPKKLLEKLSQSFPINNIAVDTPDELTFFTKDNIKITFLYYPFKPHFKILELEDGLSLFPVQEIAVQKAYTIGRRGEYRDYFDLYTILKHDYTDLKQIISVAKSVYGSIFDEKIFLEQLVYFGDLSNFDIVPAPLTTPADPKEIKRFFTKLVKSHI